LILIISIPIYGINIMVQILFATLILYTSIFVIPIIIILYLTNLLTRIDNMLSNEEEKHELRRSERLLEKRLKKSSSENLVN